MGELSGKDAQLLANIHSRAADLESLLETVQSHWVYEDLIYRFYHQSFKVYAIQDETRRIVEALRSLAPDGVELSAMFEEIIHAGASGKQFEMEHNKQWTAHTRPFIEAFMHARYFLEMAVKYGKELREAPTLLPSGWAALLCLYDLR